MGDAHRVGDRETEFPSGFLLQSGSGERRCGIARRGFLLDGIHLIASVDAQFQELTRLFFRIETMGQLSGEVVLLTVFHEGELRRDAIGAGLHKVLDLFLAFDDEAHGHRLHTACRQRGFHLLPQQGRQLITDKAVEHTTSLLGSHETHVDVARVLDGIEDGSLGDFVEDDTLGVFLLQVEGLIEVPRDGFSLAVLIGCQPHRVGGFREFPQLGH